MNETMSEIQTDQAPHEQLPMAFDESLDDEHTLDSVQLTIVPEQPEDVTIATELGDATHYYELSIIPLVNERDLVVKDAVLAMGNSLELQPDLATLETIYRAVDRKEMPVSGELTETVVEHVAATDVIRPHETTIEEAEVVVGEKPEQPSSMTDNIIAEVLSYELMDNDPYATDLRGETNRHYSESAQTSLDDDEFDMDEWLRPEPPPIKAQILDWASKVASKVSEAFAIVLGIRQPIPVKKVSKIVLSPKAPETEADVYNDEPSQNDRDYTQVISPEAELPERAAPVIVRRPRVEAEITYETPAQQHDVLEFSTIPAVAFMPSDTSQFVAAQSTTDD